MKCETCGKTIPKRRLAILPDTTTCVDCSEVVEMNEWDVQLDGTAADELIRVVQP